MYRRCEGYSRALDWWSGPGGIGKTRLALEIARDLAAEEDSAAIVVVELASVTDALLVPDAVAEALGVRQQAGRSTFESLMHLLRKQRLLLVLDNCEHLLETCAELAGAILRDCAGVRILATSRQRLDVAGETTWRVPSLAVPGETLPLVAVHGSAAVRLFVERAAAMTRGFALSPVNARAAARAVPMAGR